ncbi:rRNA (cytosine-C5-)-methyltransferase RCM1 [Paracoccidioides brasiliensis Pb18]|uniref:SAM-dependent MTase RsmB/NOP-type domain-containing protein n=1 Tax=Paracoccidioides brasiliensis (strain Pb18) TaxID=502780 RepID=C1GH28_PARBD|nr:rRNA (cytosine-C5-)-methyltransferase RCM1 [Paracoccidioides brasiliensis Pb18]EEH50485.1 hypothetical protein PADG_06564 [Paracoccidioides brasiliensis Pb18]
MSLYVAAASILDGTSGEGGSFKSRVYNSKLKPPPAQVYALITEASKWDILLKEVVENAGFLPLEPKLTPIVSILLVHDLLLARRGIVAPSNHHLRLAIERHKSRIKAEFVKSRVRRRCGSVEELKALIAKEKRQYGAEKEPLVSPRWVRINKVLTTLDKELNTTFASYKSAASLLELSPSAPQTYYRDSNVPDLLAVPQGVELTSSTAYKRGRIILQDKASCFPAYLLLGDNPEQWKGDLIDSCAAPGNKTTHLASLMCSDTEFRGGGLVQKKPIIFSCDASQSRSNILQRMVSVAGVDKLVSVLPGQDFLALNPCDKRFQNVTGLLLDPSCSGSGIVGRVDVPRLALPTMSGPRYWSKKRKRTVRAQTDGDCFAPGDSEDQSPTNVDYDRLFKLSNLQKRIIEHAFNFPAATRVTYSTCSIHAQENEVVVSRVLKSPVARRRGWRILSRSEQVQGLRNWKHRGIHPDGSGDGEQGSWHLTEAERDACLRCWPNDEQGTGGFFVAGFIRDNSSEGNDGSAVNIPVPVNSRGSIGEHSDDASGSNSESEWEGFSSD